jgi:hypothetical protein
MARRLLALCAGGLMAAGVLGAVPATGATGAAHWSIVASPNRTGVQNGQLDAVSCATAAACTAVGSALNSHGVTVPLAKSWNGRKWAVQPVAFPAGATVSTLTGISCVSATACVAVGETASDRHVAPMTEVWNGARWAARPVPVPAGAVYSTLSGVSCVSATLCIAVGVVEITASEMPLVEVWNGATWAARPLPVPAGSDDAAFAGVSCASATACVAVGRLDEGDSTVPAAEAWNGVTWAVQPVPAPAGSGDVSALAGVSCTSAAACIAVGHDNAAMLAERWNGTKWAIQPVPVPADGSAPVSVSCASAIACTAVGPAIAARWNGTNWTIQRTASLGTGDTGFLSGVSCASARRCTAVGYYQTAVAQPTLAERWNGSAWDIQPTPGGPGIEASNSLAAVSCISATDCTAVGNYDPAGNGSGKALAERWNGTTWVIRPVPSPAGAQGSSLSGVSCTSARACTAVGSFIAQHGQSIFEVTLAERWNGVRWSVQPTPSPSARLGNSLSAVSCASRHACVAVGSYGVERHGKIQTPMLAERWNGGKWTVTRALAPPRISGGSLNGVSCTSETKCVAVGDYYTGSVSQVGYLTLTERWNGRKWAIQRTPDLAGEDFSILSAVSCTSARACTAVGSYDDPAVGGLELAERWNGRTWAIEPVPVPGGILQANSLSAVSCASARSCTAVSTYLDVVNGEQALAEHWNGTKWAIQPIPDPPGLGVADNDLSLSGVSCTLATACAAVGSYQLSPSDSSSLRTLAERNNR